MKKINKKYHEVIISDDPEKKRRVAMEHNGQFYVMVIEERSHGSESYDREQLEFVEDDEE
jgi:F420-dependent methylenetetrahydromethanopterin dehydrogenase